jgi:hypothetical protein
MQCRPTTPIWPSLHCRSIHLHVSVMLKIYIYGYLNRVRSPITSHRSRCWRLRSRLFHRRQPAARYCRPTAASEADRSWMALHQDQGPLMVVVRGGFLSSRVARFVWAWAEAAAIGIQIDVGLKIRRHLVTLGLGQCYVVWSRRRGGRRESRETAALRLGTAGRVGNRPRRTGTGGIRRPPGTACWRNSPAWSLLERSSAKLSGLWRKAEL